MVAILQFAIPALPAFGIGESIGDRAVVAGIPPELPLGIFFSIWSFIFFGLIGIAVLHMRDPDAATESLAPPLMLAAHGNILWLLNAHGLGSAWVGLILLGPKFFFNREAAYSP
ncbi:MAG: hypothetical protein VX599_07745, partial [Pseudomonadota bacterium]|nr:hypothetical protein [Pseudomonadota bacterium]